MLSAGCNSGDTLTWPGIALSFRSQETNPLLVIVRMWSPGDTSTDAGVLPTKAPSISISAAVGLEEISNTDTTGPGVAVIGAFEAAEILTGVGEGIVWLLAGTADCATNLSA